MDVQQHLADLAATLRLLALELNDSGCARLLFDGTIAVNSEHNELAGQLKFVRLFG